MPRALMILLALLLAMMPVSVFADVSKSDITYVSLGDSLAAGLLSDGITIGKGYVGNIVEQLEDYGYDISMENFGVPGAKTNDVLARISDAEDSLMNADIITISAGANDLISQLDMGKITDFDPNEIERVYEELETEVLKAMGEIGMAAEQLTGVVAELKLLLEDAMGKLVQLLLFYPVTYEERSNQSRPTSKLLRSV